jgi:flagellar hook-length control protein FliK
LFASVANAAATPANSPVAEESGKSGDGAREDDGKGAQSAFELAASMALAAAEVGRNEARTVPKTRATSAAAESVVDSSPVASPRAVSNVPTDFFASARLRPAAVTATQDAPKRESIQISETPVQRSEADLEAELRAARSPAPKPEANAVSVKAAPMPAIASEPIAAPPRETHGTAPRLPESAERAQPAARPRIELSPRALAQAAIVEAVRSPGRGRSQPASDGESRAAKDAAPGPSAPAAASTPPAPPIPVAPPIAEAMKPAVDESPLPPLAGPMAASAPDKPAASSRAAADILRQRQYALGADASPIGDIVPESAVTFETLIALRKADGALEGHASLPSEHESAAPVSSGSWLPDLPSSASQATTPASAVAAPRVFDPAAWNAALAQQITASAVAAAKETTVRVEPEGLGPIEVRVQVKAEHVDVRFAIEHPVTVNMVRAALPDLERMLAQSGLNLGDAQIAQQNAGQRGHAMPNRNASSNAADDEPIAVASSIESQPRARVGLLDDFV